jgi:wyosine [tRNA(Phe)-imidazoG37] synthetase (radical SAM superfamily)
MKSDFHSVDIVVQKLDSFLSNYKLQEKSIDTITFAGNGEPTLHPKFNDVIEQTIRLRDLYYPEAKISVLTNATMLHSQKVVDALKKIDNRILKLDSAIEKTALLINQPLASYSIDKLIAQFKQFGNDFIVQTMFLKGSFNNVNIDNTTEKEIDAYLSLMAKIKPQKIMIYTIARDTPAKELEKISLHDLNRIASKIEKIGIAVEVSG